MTLRRLWMMMLVFVAVVAIGVNTLILTILTGQYFSEYLNETYALHVEEIVDYTTIALTSDDFTYDQMAIELETHLYDPIIGIRVYQPDGKILLEVESDYYLDDNMMGGMMSRMLGQFSNTPSEEVHQYEITSNGEVIALVNITLHSIAENSFVARRFKNALLSYSLYSVAITIGIAILVGSLISAKMSQSLKDTEKLANDIQLGKDTYVKHTGIKEVNAIRESLKELNARLRLKQQTRESLVDQLVHQTRTPLTILKSHLEAIEDGVIQVDEKELSVCQNQIDEITMIISNMSSMIDAGLDTDELLVESFDFSSTLKQIHQGLLTQFTSKNIQLEIISDEIVELTTDKYKLSQSIYNLLTNAYKYTNELGSVRISYYAIEESLTIKIQDTGIGIAQKDYQKVFEAYYRSPKAFDERGEGIGLYIVKGNIEKIGGTVSVESKVGSGTTFTISIPMNIEKK